MQRTNVLLVITFALSVSHLVLAYGKDGSKEEISDSHLQATKRISDTFDILRHLGTKSPYFQMELPANYTPAPQGCSLIHLNLVARHGERYPTAGNVKKFNKLEKVLANYSSAITNPQFSWLKSWKNPFKDISSGLLTVKGMQEHYNLSKRFLENYSDLMSELYYPQRYPIQTTQVTRAARSGNTFGFGLFEGKGPLGSSGFLPFYQYTETDDIELRFFEECSSYANSKPVSLEAKAWLNNNSAPVAAKIQKLLGVDPGTWSITVDQMETMWNLCTFEASAFTNVGGFCSLFDDNDILMFEYYEDLDAYWVKSYGHTMNYEISCPLLGDFFDQMDAKINGTGEEQNAKLRFAHAETIIPYVSLLGLFKDGEPLTAQSSAEFIANRKFRTSTISPYAANVAFLLYQCSDNQYMVKLMHNEKEYPFPACNDSMYCPYDTVKQYYSQPLSCNFDAMCGIELCTISDSGPLDDGSRIAVFSVSLFGAFAVGVVAAVLVLQLWWKHRKTVPEHKYLDHRPLLEDPSATD